VLPCGDRDVHTNCALAAGVVVMATEIDPRNALEACMDCFPFVTMGSVVGQIDIFTTAPDQLNVITLAQ